jgi:DNA-binding IclR family transcriptional regulator
MALQNGCAAERSRPVRVPEAFFVSRTMQALEALALRPQSAPQLAETLQIHPRTARRMLNRLADEGYVVRSDDARRRYSLTMRVVALAGQVAEGARLTRLGVPYVHQIHADVGTPAHLMVPSHRSVLCLVHCAGESVCLPHLRELVPSHCTATGKALLSWRERWRESVLGEPLERHTDRTMTDPAVLREEIARSRLRGYAVEDEEFELGVRAVAAPVFGAGGEAVASLGAAVPATGEVEVVAASVLSRAEKLTSELAEEVES